MFSALGAVALIVGGIGIANITLLQFMSESAMIGLLGGLIGAALGGAGVVVVSAIKGWTPVLEIPLVGASALLGGAIGLAAGIYPALRAASIEPISALRGGV